MYTTDMLLGWLGDTVISYHPGKLRPDSDGGIKFLEAGSEPLQPDCLYIGTPDAITDAISEKRISSQGACMILCNAERPLPDKMIPAKLTLIETRLPLLSLYNCVSEHLHRFHEWEAGLQEIVYTNGGLQRLLEKAYSELHTTILLVNAGYKHIASVYDPDVFDATANELRANGYQSFDSIQSIQHERTAVWSQDQNHVEYLSGISGNYTMVSMIRYNNNLVARLCVIVNGPERNSYYADLLEILSRFVAEYMFSHQGADYAGNAAFGLLAADLIEFRLTDPEELQQRLKQIKLATRRYYHVMIISFDNASQVMIPWNYIISQLEHIFPFSNITTYKGQILLIIRKMKRGSRLSFDESSLLKLLESYGGYACVSNSSEFLTSLPPIYYQTKDALRLGMAMDPETRIYYYEEYSIFQIIELAAEAAGHNLGSQNLVHLCNNELIALVLYDKKNGTNLVTVLQSYLLHERNTSETAKALYIHRNTMLYKIHKIEEIIGCSLEDPMLRERMLFSCRVLEYMTKYRKEDILVLKRSKMNAEMK